MLFIKQFLGRCVQDITLTTIEIDSIPITDSSLTFNTTSTDLYTVKGMTKVNYRRMS